MRPLAIVPALCALAALILTLLCLFGGSTTSFLPSVSILTLNTSRVGHGELFNTSDGDGGFFSNLGNEIEGELNGLVGNVTSDIAKAIGLKDFYTVHVMNYCEGFFEPNSTAKHAKQNITFCSKRNPSFHFDINTTLSNELIDGTSLSDIHWPGQIQTELNALKVAFKAMFVFYCIAIAFAAICLLTSIFGVFGGGRLSAFGNFTLFSLGFISTAIASIIATVIMIKAVHVINNKGSDIGLAASKSPTMLGLTWGATGAIGLGAMAWVVECIIGRRHRKQYVEKS